MRSALACIVIARSAVAGAPSAEQLWADLVAGNQRFVSGKLAAHDPVAKRGQLASSQSPGVAVLGCSDSRVAPELLFDQGLGDMFVVRNAGNSPDPISIGSLEYAVEHLGTTVIVVLGHTSCGAVTAACSGDKPATPSLAAVVEPIAPSCAAGKRGGKTDLPAAIRDHVHRSAQQLLASSDVLRAAVAKGTLTVIEAVYDLDTGKVVRMK
jgi:carbonic anhydrase